MFWQLMTEFFPSMWQTINLRHSPKVQLHVCAVTMQATKSKQGCIILLISHDNALQQSWNIIHCFLKPSTNADFKPCTSTWTDLSGSLTQPTNHKRHHKKGLTHDKRLLCAKNMTLRRWCCCCCCFDVRHRTVNSSPYFLPRFMMPKLDTWQARTQPKISGVWEGEFLKTCM